MSFAQGPSETEVFMDVTDVAGITATHRASWNEFSVVTPFTDGYMGIGQAWGDYNNDGWPDLYVTGNLDSNVLYRNNGDGSFSESTLSTMVSLPNTKSGGAVWADYDNDGWRDLYVLAHGANTLYRNVEGKTFEDVTDVAKVGDMGKGSSAAWGDYDNDGFLDLYVANWSCYPNCDPIDHSLNADRLYHNNGDGTFADVSDLLQFEKLLGAGFSASFVDYDNDQDLDIYVINDKLKNPIGNVLWRNDGAASDTANCNNWCWTDVSAESGADIVLHGMGLAVGDYDNDLDLDLYFSNMVEPMALLQNRGDGTFDEVAKAAGVNVGPSDAVGWGTSFIDFDNDSWLDLFLAATSFRHYDRELPPDGMHFPYRNFLFQNQGDTTFTDTSPPSWHTDPQRTMGFAYADYNRDGWVDYIVGNWNSGYRLYHNQGLAGQGNGWLTIHLSGGGPVNQDAIGARVYLTLSDGRTLLQEVKSGSSLGAGNDIALHFGLGKATADNAKIRWPNGIEHTLWDVPYNQRWEISYLSVEDDLSKILDWSGLVCFFVGCS